jgi:hypothetical protein
MNMHILPANVFAYQILAYVEIKRTEHTLKWYIKQDIMEASDIMRKLINVVNNRSEASGHSLDLDVKLFRNRI